MKINLAARGCFSRDIVPALYPRHSRPQRAITTGLHGKRINEQHKQLKQNISIDGQFPLVW